MDIFDQYLFEELTTRYSESDLSAGDYKELYQRFCNIDYLEDVKPYLLAMRFWGLGTAPEKEQVLAELKLNLRKGDHILNGLYYDLLLSESSNDANALINLQKAVDEGYTNIFTKEKNHITNALSVENYFQKTVTIQRLVQTLRKIASTNDDIDNV